MTDTQCSQLLWQAGQAAPRTCPICGLGPCQFCQRKKTDFSKESILSFAKRKRDETPSGEERDYFSAIYFVLRNRTEENWGPRVLTMEQALNEDGE